ncbi:bZIP transcription factor [Cryomyces antarcticus]
MGDNGPVDKAAVSKMDQMHEGSTSSIASTPEPDAEAAQDHSQPQKRKGGRKPMVALTKRGQIYATSEERKQRNRQAQAAFRERRTEYIKQLEATIKLHEDNLQNLQQSHRSAADECLMLRYKNSLLERVLLERGIDVQTELHARTGSPALVPTHMPPAAPAPQSQPPAQRAIMNRHHQARRSGVGLAPKLDVSRAMAQPQADAPYSSRSPPGHPTPSSHSSSPTAASTRSPGMVPQGGMTPPTSALMAQQQQQLRSQQQPPRPQFQPHPPAQLRPSLPATRQNSGSVPRHGSGVTGVTSGGPASYYPSPFENHMNQLGKLTRPLLSTEQEYDAQADMLDDQDPSDHSAGPGAVPFPPHPPYRRQQPPPHGPQRMQQHSARHAGPRQAVPQHSAGQAADGSGPVFSAMNQLFDPYDPMLDADPFGLSASMHFPTQFSYDQQQQMR